MELVDTDMAAWPPGTRHYRDGETNFAVDADPDPLPNGRAAAMVGEVLTILGADLMGTKVILRPTVVWVCTPDGLPTEEHGMAPLHTFPAGTSHESAIENLGA